MTTAEKLQQELSQHYGTENYYKHPLNATMVYTDGVKAFAEAAEAYWLLDIMATEVAALLETEEFLSIELIVAGGKAKLFADDGNSTILYVRDIEYTDCPTGSWKFFMTNDVLMLPSEY